MISHPLSLPDILARFHEHAATRPDTLCAHTPAAIWTWGELHQNMLREREYFVERGVKEGHVVGLCHPRSLEWIAKWWALWELKVCVLFLDPARHTPLTPAVLKLAHGISAPREWHKGLATEPSVHDYLILTSGSTGEPKPVGLSCEWLPALWEHQAKAFHVEQSSHCSWMLSPGFDASLSDVGVALWAGVPLYIVPENRWKRYTQCVDDITRHSITHADMPPSLLARWSDKPPLPLQTLVTGGEPVPESVWKSWAPHLRWINVYGPTEATVCVSAEQKTSDASTIGQPFSYVLFALHNTQLNEHPQDQEEGELWIGGPLALGYEGLEQATSERFVCHNGKRWFKTRDWVRKDKNAWVFLGRMDRQIKHLGAFVHLEAIEHALRQHPKVLNAGVVKKHNKLHAYVEWRDDSVFDVGVLRTWLEHKLNQHHQPHFFHVLGCLPIKNGKIDYQLLEDL